jgi:hypothetical protein
MAALNTDLLKKLARKWVGQIGAGGVADAVVTTVPLSSAIDLPADTAVVATIDRVDVNGVATASLEETVIGIVSSSNLISCVRGAEGTAQAHNAGAVVEILITAKGYNDIIDAILVQHNQLGGHTTLTASSVSSNTTVAATTNLTASAIGSPTATLPLEVLTGTYQPFQAYTPADAGTATLDLALGNDHRITMPAGNITIALSHATVGQKFLVSITQDGTGSRTVTWFTTIKWAGGSAPTLTTTASKRDTFGFVVTGSGTYDAFVVGQNL